jgi:hypothetical protein
MRPTLRPYRKIRRLTAENTFLRAENELLREDEEWREPMRVLAERARSLPLFDVQHQDAVMDLALRNAAASEVLRQKAATDHTALLALSGEVKPPAVTEQDATTEPSLAQLKRNRFVARIEFVIGLYGTVAFGMAGCLASVDRPPHTPTHAGALAISGFLTAGSVRIGKHGFHQSNIADAEYDMALEESVQATAAVQPTIDFRVAK